MQLLAAGADPNETNADGWTPLMFAAMANDVAIAGVLLAAGADVNRRGRDGSTALLKGALWADLPLIALLLRHGADRRHRDAEGWTAERVAKVRGHRMLAAALEAGDSDRS